MKTLSGKRALVTGAAAGIGRALALALARQGVDLYLIDLDLPRLQEVASQARGHGVGVTAVACDLASAQAVRDTVRGLLATWGHLDILVNNAGVSYYGPTERMSADQWDAVLRVNLLAPAQLTHELLPTLLARDEAHILNVCSIAGLVGLPKMAAYQASKFGLVGLSESLRLEYRRRGLGVTSLCPGFVRTDMLREATRGKKARPLLTRWLTTTPEKVADRAVRAIRADRGVVLVTPLAHALWFLKRLAPRGAEFLRGLRKRKAKPAQASPPADPKRRAVA